MNVLFEREEEFFSFSEGLRGAKTALIRLKEEKRTVSGRKFLFLTGEKRQDSNRYGTRNENPLPEFF